jgi:hypothetical protein
MHSRDAGRLGVRGEHHAAVVLSPEHLGEGFASLVHFDLGQVREAKVDLLMAEHFELTLRTETGVNLDEVFADRGLTPRTLAA